MRFLQGYYNIYLRREVHSVILPLLLYIIIRISATNKFPKIMSNFSIFCILYFADYLVQNVINAEAHSVKMILWCAQRRKSFTLNVFVAHHVRDNCCQVSSCEYWVNYFSNLLSFFFHLITIFSEFWLDGISHLQHNCSAKFCEGNT